MDWELNTLLNELKQGKEVTNQLMKHLHPPSSHQTRQALLHKILCSYDKALSILNSNGFLVETNPTAAAFDVSDKKDVFKRRKTSSGWTEQLRLCSAKSLDNPLDDGYCWRKYGQKAILGSNFPRGYYRCTHRHSQGCLAIKQVQRSDNDPTNFEVKYRGRHTCNQASHFAATIVPVPTESKEKGNHSRKRPFQLEQKQKQKVQHVFSSLESGLVVKTEDLDNREQIFPSFSFPVESEQVKNGLFAEALMENDIMGNLSPAFMSPATSESNYFSVSPCHMGSFESDLTDIMSDPTSVTNSPIGDLDISSLDKLEFDPSFPFDNPEFFS
ncbi:WRKY DNA-binding protein 46, WRKY DNA-BINDING PROTEIN 46 [Hibiscus trionum]|uniref:WRKY DNA-binding protein 46, WRKY DNA-BINDING PROTEIN 46 n=1 Tax=Hibiscus trionum TaxID=183268 RepID=A0A9W7INX0_HIBTR|nr:WRKY DNA-binding protein 46, WRKY DNA-BINDING PROTEIN 46 [Hibiscus trionum]